MRTQWNIDHSHSSIGFVARHLVVSKVRGNFGAWSAEIELDPQNLTDAKIVVKIDTASISTNEPKRDAHLRSADFFDAEKFPTAMFVSKKVLKSDEETYRVIGDLSIRGTTKEVTLTVHHLGVARDPWGQDHIGFSAEAQIDRRDWGLVWNQPLANGGLLVSEKIGLEIELEAIEQKAATKAA